MANGPELVSVALADWAEKRGVDMEFIQPGKPTQNSYIERLNRTFRHGRVFRNVEEVRTAVGAFIARYNREWRVEKNRFFSPLEIRQQWLDQAALARVA